MFQNNKGIYSIESDHQVVQNELRTNKRCGFQKVRFGMNG